MLEFLYWIVEGIRSEANEWAHDESLACLITCVGSCSCHAEGYAKGEAITISYILESNFHYLDSGHFFIPRIPEPQLSRDELVGRWERGEEEPF